MDTTERTVKLTGAFLRALAEGVERLERGDLHDIATEVRHTMARDHKLIESGFCWWSADTATAGWAKVPDIFGSSVFVTQSGDGVWFWRAGNVFYERMPNGTVIYLDEDCTIPLRTIAQPPVFETADDNDADADDKGGE